MATRSGSSRRKHEQPKRKTEEDQIDLTDGDEDPGENGVGSEDDVIELPEGTVVVNPEPVDDNDESSSTPKSAKKRQQKSSLSMSVELNKLMSRILCTSCGKQINPMNPGAVRRHPWLKCTTCKKCYKFLKSGPIQKDADGLDEQCRWCGEGGRLYGCDYCHNTFCRPCIKRNLGRSEAAKVEDGTGKWKCYVCRPHMMKELVENCNKIIAAIEKEEQREKARVERAKEREKQAKIKEKEGNQSKDEKPADKSRDSKAGTPTRVSLRAPVPKSQLKIEDSDKAKSNKTSAKDAIIISDDKPSKSYKNEPIVISDSKSDKKGSTVLSLLKEKNPVMVGPRPRQPVTMPYINKTVPISSVNNQGNRMINNNPNSNPLLMNAMQLKFGNSYTRGLNPRPPINEIQGLLQSVYPYNVDSSVDKLIAASQSLSLSLNGIKTDLAIGKLTNVNMFNARNTAASSLKSGLAVFFNSVREIFNVQITASAGGAGGKGGQAANANVPSSTVVIDGKPAGTNLAAMANEYLSTSTPIKEEGGKQKLDISEIPILVDDSPMKKSTSEPVMVDKADSSEKEGSEGAESKDDSCVVVSQSDDDNEKDDDEESVTEDDKTDKKSTTEKKKKMDKEKGKKSEKVEDNDKESNESDGAMEVDDDNEKEEEEKEDEGGEKKSDEEEVHGETLENVGSKSQKLMQEYKKLAEQIETQNEKGENSENLAAQLELLKEMADELSQELGDEEEEEEDEQEEEESEEDNKRKSKRSTRANDKQNKSDSKSNKSSSEKDGDDKSSHSGSKRSLRSSVDSEKLKTKEKEKTSESEKSDRKVKSSEKDSSIDESTDESSGKTLKKSESVKSLKKSESEKSLKKSESEKSPSKSDTRSTRLSLRSKKDENTDSEAETSKESQKSVSKSKSEGDNAKDGKSKSDKKKSEQDKSKSEADDSTEKDTERKVTKSPSKASKETTQKKGKSKVGKVTEIVTDSETDDSDIDGAPKEEKAEVDLPMDSDDSSELEIDDSNLQSRSTRAKTKGKGKGSKSKSPVRSKGKDDGKDKEGKCKKSSKRSDDDEEENDDYKSDSSNFDPELEKEIKGISKSLASDGKPGKKKKKGKESQEGSEVEAEDKKGKKGKEKKKVEKKGKESDEEESSDDNEEEMNGEEEEEEEDEEDNLSPSKLRKLRAAREAARKKEEDEDEEEEIADANSEDSDDLEVSFPKLQGSKKGKKKAAEDMSEDSDFQPTSKKRIRSKLLDAKILGDDDSDEDKPKKGKKGGKGGKRKRKNSSSEEEEEDEEDEEEEESGTEDYSDDDEDGGKKKKKGKGKKGKGKGKKGKKGKGKKRRRIKRMSSDDEDDVQKDPGEDDELEDDSDDEGQGGFMKRKKIRKLMKNKKLTSTTKQAQKAEEARRKRIAERQKEFNSYIEVEGEEDEEDLPEGVEREKEEDKDDKEDGKDNKKEKNGDTISKILGSPRKVPVTTKLILEMDKEKKKPIIEVDRTLIRKLKPHQVDAVRFIYNCTVESIERLKKKEESGSGCIVAHCMGLGKTLSVITYVHTMLKSHKYTKMEKCLVVCPLNTVLNWVNEFEIWLTDVDFEIEVYELSRVKMNSERAQMLKEWQTGGAGVMILGYDMYRNLVQGSHCKNKKQKAIFQEALVDPGPDLVVCDEGHILKNDQTSISKSMNRIKSKRRIVLTGTPLQNNLGEYHCMVSFVKPNLLGTRKEFGNRFVNPITNGQCTDSTVADVKLMKRRAHVLHEMLAGCVQRKDYSALTKFLPPKFEYVISVRLAPIQMDLYQKHLDRGAEESIVSKGARLFKDYQALMRIWTHPWVLKLDEVRQQNKAINDDTDDSFIDDYQSGDDSFIDDSTSEGEVSPMDLDSGSEKGGKGKGKGKRKSRRTRGSRKKSNSNSDNSDSDNSKKSNDGPEVVRKWTSRRRHNEEGAGASWMDIGVPDNEYVNKEVSKEWWAEYVKEEDQYKMELSGKLTLLFEILKMCEDIGDKVLVFSQSLLSLDIIEDFLAHIDEMNQNPEDKKDEDKKEGDKKDEGKKGDKKGKENGEVAGGSGAGGSAADAGGSGDGPEKKEDKFAEYGKNWTRGADYFRMDGSTNAQNRKAAQNQFNDEENYRARLFLISTKAGSLGINLVSANRVIIFDASWNPSHDIQSIFRVYRFGQVKPVYVYRFLAQGTMEEKIYERQVTKQSLSQRVVDEHQIERHFTTNDLQELYKFSPDRLDDPNRKEKLPMLPKDHMLAELMTNHKEWIVTFHEHDSLLENIVAQELSEEEKKAAWEDYEEEKKGLRVNPMMNMYQGMAGMMGQGMPGMGGVPIMNQGMMNPAVFKNLLDVGQSTLGPNGVLRIVQDLKARFPNLPPDMFQQRVQAVLRQILTNQIMQQSEMQRRQLDNQQMAELNRLYQVKQQIQQQERILQQSRVRMSGIGGATGVNPGVAGVQNPQMRISGSEPNLTGMRNQNQNQR